MLSYCVPLLNCMGCWRTWSIMKLQTTLAPDILHILLLVFSTILGVFWASYHISLCLTNLNQNPKNSIYPMQTSRPSGQTVGHRYSLTRYSKSCSIIIWSQGRSCVGDPKANIQHTQTHTPPYKYVVQTKKCLSKWEVFHQHIISPKISIIFSLHRTPKYLDFDSPCDWLPQGPGTQKKAKYHLALWASWLPPAGLGHFLLILSYRFFPWERFSQQKTAFRWKSWGLSLCNKKSFFLKIMRESKSQIVWGIKKISWRICFFKSCMCW